MRGIYLKEVCMFSLDYMDFVLIHFNISGSNVQMCYYLRWLYDPFVWR